MTMKWQAVLFYASALYRETGKCGAEMTGMALGPFHLAKHLQFEVSHNLGNKWNNFFQLNSNLLKGPVDILQQAIHWELHFKL